jgi:hypothetical protein
MKNGRPFSRKPDPFTMPEKPTGSVVGRVEAVLEVDRGSSDALRIDRAVERLAGGIDRDARGGHDRRPHERGEAGTGS